MSSNPDPQRKQDPGKKIFKKICSKNVIFIDNPNEEFSHRKTSQKRHCIFKPSCIYRTLQLSGNPSDLGASVYSVELNIIILQKPLLLGTGTDALKVPVRGITCHRQKYATTFLLNGEHFSLRFCY